MARSVKGALLSCGALIALYPQMPAFAQAARTQNSSEPAKSGRSIDEIVVTALRKEQSTLDVPLSVAATSGETLVKLGVRDIGSIQFLTPGFVPAQRSDATLLYVRGVGNGLFTGADPSVATYVDDVPRVYGQLISALLDVERIEVLKGAQGGLYGRNATGGVLNIVTRPPSMEELAGDARASYGTHDTLRLAAYVNVPLSEKAAFSISGTRDRHSSYATNDTVTAAPYTAAMFPSGSTLGTPQQTADFFNSGVQPRRGYNAEDLWAVNGKLLLMPTDNLKLTLAGDFNEADDTQGVQARQLDPGYMQGVVQSFFNSFGVNAVLPSSFVYSTTKKFHVVRGAQSRNDIRSYGGSLTAVASLDQWDLTSITAYRENYAYAFDELGDVNVPLITNDSVKRAHFFYQEARATSTGSRSFHLIAGATYLNNYFAQNTFSVILPPLLNTGLISSVARTKNWSVYAQVSYDVTGRFTVTGSGRYIYEKNNTSFSQPVVSATSQTVKKFLPSITASYSLSGGGNAYVRWARGMKGGGVNPVSPPNAFPTTLGSLFGPEIVDTYEIGYRAALADHAVQLTTAVFYNDYKGLQTSVAAKPQYPAIIYSIVNAGTARTWGAEVGLTWRIARPITLGLNGGYLNARYKHFSIPDGTPLVPFNQDGDRMKNAPEWQFSAFADVDVPVGDKVRVVGSVLASYTSSILFNSSGAVGILAAGEQPSYWMVNGRIGLASADDRYRVSLFANNLFNTEYATAIASTGSTGVTATLGNPRVVGVELAGKF